MASPQETSRLRGILHSPHFWLILALLVAFTILHYAEQMGMGGTVSPSAHFGLTRHAMDRILFLLPIVYAGFVFGQTAGLITAFVTLLIMLPRAIFVSLAPPDALFEVGAVLVVGVLACLWLGVRQRESGKYRQSLERLETAHQELQAHIRVSRSNEKRLATLNAISTVLTQSLELKEVLRRAIDLGMESMEVEVALIFLLDEEAKELELLAYEGVSEEFARAVDRIKLGEGFNGRVAESGEPMVVEDASRDPRLARAAVRKMGIQSQVIVPLKSKGRVVGTLCAAMRRPREFIREEVDLLTAIGNQIGIAIENARLYEKERRIAEKLLVSERNYRGLFENANDAIWVHDLEGDIIAANKAAEKLTGFTAEELNSMNVRDLLDAEGLHVARRMRDSLLSGEPVEQPYEQRLIRKDGTEAVFMLASSLVTSDGQPTGFQHIARDVTEEKRMHENLRFYVQQTTKTQEEERKRIARELHDDTGQALYALTRQVDNFVRSNAHLSKEDVAFLKGMREQIDEVLQGVRRFSQDLRPSILDDLGLLPALGWLTHDLEKECGIEANLTVLGVQRRLTPEAELVLFRIVQEALSNIRRHAQASKTEVIIEFGESKLRVTVSDNGKGFELPERVGDLTRTGKLGLIGMQERARLLGGTLTLRSELGEGTTTILDVPMLE